MLQTNNSFAALLKKKSKQEPVAQLEGAHSHNQDVTGLSYVAY